MDTSIPTTEKEFIEEILELLYEEPDKINPSSLTNKCLYVKRPEDSSARVADNCIIGKWLTKKGFDLSRVKDTIAPANEVFENFLSFEDVSNLGIVADQIQEFADGAGAPLVWGKVASAVRDFYKAELEMESA